jgi:hypothetical protein
MTTVSTTGTPADRTARTTAANIYRYPPLLATMSPLGRKATRLRPRAGQAGRSGAAFGQPDAGGRLMGSEGAGFGPKIAFGLPLPEVHLQAHPTTVARAYDILHLNTARPISAPWTPFRCPRRCPLMGPLNAMSEKGACPLSGLFRNPHAH